MLTHEDLWDIASKNQPCRESTTGTEYSVTRYDTTIVIAFESTRDTLDWKQNFSFWVRPYKHQDYIWLVHSGFRAKWKSVESDIQARIEDILRVHRITSIQVTGHSQGGAIAFLCHEFCKYWYSNMTIETVTFGAPRVLCTLFSKNILKSGRFCGIVNYQIWDDIVVHLPPKWLGYIDVGVVTILQEHIPLFERVRKLHCSYGELLRRL